MPCARAVVIGFQRTAVHMPPISSTMSHRKKPAAADCQSFTSFFAKRSRLGNIRVLNLNRTVAMKQSSTVTAASTSSASDSSSISPSPVQLPATSTSSIGRSHIQ